MSLTVDTLIEASWIIPVEPAQQVLTDHALMVDQGHIIDLLPAVEARERYQAKNRYVLDNHALIPGLINLHSHAPMSLLRGFADDLPLMTWLKGHIWPAEQKHVNYPFAFDGARLACAEMLRGGITCFNEMYFFPDAVADAAISCGLRATIGMVVIDVPTAWASDADEYLHKGLALRDRLLDEPLLRFALAPHAPYTVSNRTFEKIGYLAEQLDLPIHIHLHETRDEISQSLTAHGQRPLARLHDLGLTGPQLIAVHGVHLNDQDQQLLVEHGCHLAHCPASNLKLASGIAPVAALLDAGLNIGLGSDGAASNNSIDLFADMRLAALLAKGSSGNAAALPAWQALQMATINGARALGLADQLGSLQPGKLADLTAVDLSCLATQPCYDPIAQLVYAANRNQVSHVWVHGELLLEHGEFTRLDGNEIRRATRIWHDRLRATPISNE